VPRFPPVRQRFERQTLDLRYPAMRVHNAVRDDIDLALRHVSTDDEQGVPDTSTVWLSTLPAGRAGRGRAISPSGRRVRCAQGGTVHWRHAARWR
jgi:hypothetical protein